MQDEARQTQTATLRANLFRGTYPTHAYRSQDTRSYSGFGRGTGDDFTGMGEPCLIAGGPFFRGELPNGESFGVSGPVFSVAANP